jgi:hypothetical protein
VHTRCQQQAVALKENIDFLDACNERPLAMIARVETES